MEKLKQVLAQEDTVLFIGSGVSCWSGLPTWPSLIEKLATFVEAAVNWSI
jgi:NAD-dependent SIR2 family protein deacetylase